MFSREYNPLSDFLFLKYMAEPNCTYQWKSFVNALFSENNENKEEHVEEVKLLEGRKLTKKVIKDKTSILDLRSIANSSRQINMEVQQLNLGDMLNRSLYYWSKAFSIAINEGQDYKKLPKIISISLVDFELIDLPEVYTKFNIFDGTKYYKLSEKLELYFIELPKFRKIKNKNLNNPLHRWLIFFDKNSSKELLDKVIKMDKAIETVDMIARNALKDKKWLHDYHLRAMAKSDWTSSINHAEEKGLKIGEKRGKEKGLKIGEKKGRKKGIIEVAINLKNMDLPVEQITKSTGLSKTEIEKL
ncbi:Rpn family recombination-promoting nuclease/putative transposase [Methanobrevibacter filiformis]|uniref:PD-(D/E)XK nuclease family transposase n=1 Tax=Methanobrevibacter filiformis TaxID=55758 RepID=A0A165Z6N5_9EURY|nr:Rpn family recombination-promoting nuclease/putative transposase [Methanobrevibacter filiformis]KZX10313.1 PD-(D/E)XK nuclease family transposase [Methanobrevibacter filiformis]